MKLVSLVGARPQFIKEAVVNAAARKAGAWRHVLVHSGQHYDANMSEVFFADLAIPKPDHFLGVGSGSHGAMTASVLAAFEQVLLAERPDMALVYGDTNTTLAGALAAAKLKIPVAHVEAGIRQEPRDMPEEINRVLTDHASSRLFCCSELAANNLAREGIRSGVQVVGDVMYDLYLRMASRFTPEKSMDEAGVEPERFVVATLHRDFNVDAPAPLAGILEGLGSLREETGLKVLLPLHPRTSRRVEEFGLRDLLKNLSISKPLGYLELMSLVQGSAAVVTDSGGLQKEAYFAGKRAVVVMPDTGWRELVECGWNVLAAPEADSILAAAREALHPTKTHTAIYGDGQAGRNIVNAILEA